MEKNRKVILYGAGEHAALILKRVKKAVAPQEVVAFCDSDPQKQGKLYLTYPILSWAEAERRYPDCAVYVATNERTAPEIIGLLLENGVEQERILNYEPVEKRVGCPYIESEIVLAPRGDAMLILYCECVTAGGQLRDRPSFSIPHHEFQEESVAKLLQYREEVAENLKKGHPSACCAGCQQIQERYYFAQRKIRRLSLCGDAPCNYRCLHCTLTLYDRYNYASFRDVSHAFACLERMGLLDCNTTVGVSCGEFSVNKDGNHLVTQSEPYISMLLTNGYKWSEEAAHAIRKGHAAIYCSVDAGTRETYKAIKGVDGFETVCNNLRHYAEQGTVILKYIVYEGLNDNDADIRGFFSLADAVATKVALSRDFYQEDKLSDDTLVKCAEFIRHFQKDSKMSYIVGYGRETERERLEKLLRERV